MADIDKYDPPFDITPEILRLVGEIGELVGRISAQTDDTVPPRLRKANRIRTIHGSLAIEDNSLTQEQVTAILEGKRVLAPLREIQEVRNAIAAYDQLENWTAHQEVDLLTAHATFTAGLIDESGRYRSGGVGVLAGERIMHMAPPANRVPLLMRDLLHWLENTNHHPLIASSVFHYELEFIHPFADCNGRLGRLWQTLILSAWNPIFTRIPVESLVHAHQQEYYEALQNSTQQAQCGPFISFMLAMIRTAVAEMADPQVSPQVSPQVANLLAALTQGPQDGMSREELQSALGLKDRKSFRRNYLLPAMQAGLIVMSIPDKPNSRLQKYRLRR